jgi:arylsulfatase A-like enzyme
MLTRREFVQTAAVPALLRSQRKPGDKPNLLFLWTDEQRADTMAAYGNTRYRVPAMNRLGAESVVFDRCYVSQPVCTPSRSTVMTGLWPHNSGCVKNNIPLRRETRTLPELVADSAYRTGYMGKWHLGDEIFAQHGFEQWKSIEEYTAHFSPGRDRGARSSYHEFLRRMGYQPDSSNNFSRNFAVSLPIEHTKPSYLAQEASRFIMENRREPWMLFVNTLEPHMPFTSRFNDLHDEREIQLPANYPGIPTAGEPAWYKRRREQSKQKGDEEGWRRLIRNYAGLCAMVDQAVARILWSLEVSGQAENTIVVYTSDHGDMMGSHSMYAKQVMYEEAVRVPLLMRAPFRRQRPLHVQQPVSHIDLVPTLLELLGRKDAAAGLPGESLVPQLGGVIRPDNHVFLEWTGDVRDSGAGPNGRTVISPEGTKLVLYDTDQSLLFDRRRDPGEMNNLYGKADDRRLRAKLAEWQKKTGDTFALPGV